MTWQRVRPPATKNKPAAVTIGSIRAARRKPEGLSIVVRTGAIDGGLPWLRPRQAVNVLLGQGPMAGRLRIEPGADFMPYTNSGAKEVGTLFLRGIPLPKGVVAADRQQVAVEFDYNDGWLEITLPDWARAASDIADRPAPAAAAPRAPFSLAAGVPDPAALRARGGR